jgi:hypothetical protein
MNMHVVALRRRFAGRVTVHASGIHNDFRGFTEQSARARLSIPNAREACGGTQLVGILSEGEIGYQQKRSPGTYRQGNSGFHLSGPSNSES